MKKIKLVFLICFSIILSGCDVEYNLTIDEDYMTESVDFLYPKSDENKEIVNDYLESDYMAYYDMDLEKEFSYEKTKIDNDDNVGLNLTYTYSGDYLQKSSLLDRCYYKKSITKTDTRVVITTDGINTCFYQDNNRNIDTLKVNITTEYKVLKNDADEVNGNTYTWNIDENNYQNKPINMKIDLTTKKADYSFFIKIGIAIGIIILIIGFIALFMFLKHKKNNKL